MIVEDTDIIQVTTANGKSKLVTAADFKRYIHDETPIDDKVIVENTSPVLTQEELRRFSDMGAANLNAAPKITPIKTTTAKTAATKASK